MTQCFSYLMSEQVDETALFNTLFADANEFSNLSKEVFPTIKTLLKLCAEHGILAELADEICQESKDFGTLENRILECRIAVTKYLKNTKSKT